MSRKISTYSILLLLALIMQLFLLLQSAGAWSFVSDGAVPNGSGGWSWSQASAANKQCLGCHNPTVMPDSDKTGYLLTGHKNVLRKVVAGVSASYWLGSSGQIYQADAFGRSINLLSGMITLADGSQAPMYYLYEDWMSAVPNPFVIYGSNGTDPGSGYTCAKCHTTGYGAVTASSFVAYNSPNNNITVANTFLFNPMPSLLTSVTDPVLQTATQPGSSVATQINYTGNQWVFDGVTCTRCHDVTPHGGTDQIDFAPAPTNQDGTALCYNCHQNPPSVNTVDMGGNAVTPNNFYPALYLTVGYNGTYIPSFTVSSTAQEFLNSPHGRFSGTAGQNNNGLTNIGTINNASFYASSFNDGVNNLGCTSACHDPHQSTVAAVEAATGAQPMRVSCQTCHTEIVVSKTAHPQTYDTPFDNSLYPNGSCEVCHMVRPDNGKSVRLHLFRISVDANYYTFPTPSQFRAGQVYPNTENDGSSFPGNYAAWVDVDLACGQCHGGGTAQVTTTGSVALSSPTTLTVANGSGFIEGQKIMIAGAGSGGATLYSYTAAVSGNTITLTDAAGASVTNASVTLNPTQNSAPYKSRIELAGDANNIHLTFPSPNFTWVQSGNTNTVNFNGSSTVCPSGGACAYSWAFGDGTIDNSNSINISHSYTSASPGVNNYSVVLTVTDTYKTGSLPESATKAITVNIPPTDNASVTINNLTVTLTDSSTLGSSITVNWGDGSAVSTGSAGGIFTHTYASASTYTIVDTATIQGLSASTKLPVTVPPKYTVSGVVTNLAGTVPLSSVSLSLKLNGVTKAITSTGSNGSYTFINVVPGTYTVTASKSGYMFANPADTVTVTTGNLIGQNFTSEN
ncbi:MAG: PKD domain-containing protein [Dissulfurispiraceae bacterium]